MYFGCRRRIFSANCIMTLRPPAPCSTEAHPITFDRGNVPIYRTHVAVMHFLMPTERLGVPWPVVACPPGSVAGPCRITLYKDARNPAARRDAEALRGAGDA